MYKHILVPTDGSPLSAKAVKQAVAFAKSVGAKITALHVSQEFRQMMDEGYALLDGVKSSANAADVQCDGVAVVNNLPYDAIIKQAKKAKCDLIMMASHGRKGLSSILLGSETAKVLTHSKIPVLVVR